MSNHEDPWGYVNHTKDGIPDNVDTLEDEKKSELIKKWDEGVWTENKPDTNQILKNIKLLPRIDVLVTKWVMDRIKECTDDFVNQRWLSSIALSGALCEYLSFYLLQNYIKQNGVFPLVVHAKLLKLQNDRIVLLRKLEIIEENERADLKEINDLRNKYLHIHKTDYEDIVSSYDDLIEKTEEKIEK